MKTDADRSVRREAFSAALDISMRHGGSDSVAADDLLANARKFERYLTGADGGDVDLHDGPIDEIPFTGDGGPSSAPIIDTEGERIPVFEETVASKVDLSPGTIDPVVEEQPARKQRAAKPKKAKTKRAGKVKHKAQPENGHDREAAGVDTPVEAGTVPAEDKATEPMAA